jgi:hypothetical protein
MKGTIPMTKTMLGQNVEATVDGSTLTLTIDLTKAIGPSRSGKNTLIASTNGNAVLAGGERIGVNVFRKG